MQNNKPFSTLGFVPIGMDPCRHIEGLQSHPNRAPQSQACHQQIISRFSPNFSLVQLEGSRLYFAKGVGRILCHWEHPIKMTVLRILFRTYALSMRQCEKIVIPNRSERKNTNYVHFYVVKHLHIHMFATNSPWLSFYVI